LRKSQLSEARRQLVEVCKTVNFGHLEGLTVKNGEPILDPPPRVVRELRFPGDNEARTELASTDFELKGEVAAFLADLTKLSTGTIELVEIRHGMPFRARVEQQGALVS